MTALPANDEPETGSLWTVVIPIKGGPAAKSRLAELPDSARQMLADAMALDVVEAALSATSVGAVVVVTGDPHIGWAARQLGAYTHPDPGAGLNAALHSPAVVGPRAYLLADVASLSGTDVDVLTRLARQHETSYIVDAEGSGTTAVFALHEVDTHFGPDSAAAHEAAGYTLLAPVPVAATQDVDSLADLHTCAALGLGPRAAQVFADLAAQGDLTAH